jgi:hypothetical protein
MCLWTAFSTRYQVTLSYHIIMFQHLTFYCRYRRQRLAAQQGDLLGNDSEGSIENGNIHTPVILIFYVQILPCTCIPVLIIYISS